MSQSNPHYEALEAIEHFYGRKRAERSRVPLINHIHEGCAIIDALCYTWFTCRKHECDILKAAFCIHPIIQPDVHRPEMWKPLVEHLPPRVVELAVNYSRCANAYLCTPDNDWVSATADVHAKVKPHSPTRDTYVLLMADKLQNKKDFMRYRYGRHDRSDQLHFYFELWLKYLREYV